MRRHRFATLARTLVGVAAAIVGTAVVGAETVAASTAAAGTARTSTAAGGIPAAAEGDAPTFTVTAGLRGFYDPGDRVVLTAKVSAKEVFRGTVVVVSTPSNSTVTKRIEVAGGTTKEVQLITPTRSDLATGVDVQLLDDSGEAIASTRVELKSADLIELVGVMPAMATRVGDVPEVVNLATETGRAQLATIAVEQLSLGAGALDVYDTIVASSADVDVLQPAQRSTLFDWINRGGRLLLDDDASLDALPSTWRPGNRGYALAGRGEIHVIDGAASSGRWASIIHPSGSSLAEASTIFFGDGGLDGGFSGIEEALAERAGVKLPSLAPILIVLAVYWLLASVGIYVALRMIRRLTLAWVAIPLIALLVGSGIAVFGNQWRDAGRPAAAAFIEGFPDGATAQVSVLTFSRDGGTVAVDMPGGWQSDNEVNGASRSGADPEIRSGADASQLRVLLEPGQVNTAVVSGPTSAVGLQLTATVKGNEVVGTVSNTSPYTMYDVAVFSAAGAVDIGTLAPAASEDYALDTEPLPQGFDPAGRVWRSDPELAELAVWETATASRLMYPSGTVRAAGWTDERPSDLQADELSVRTVVTTLANVAAADEPVSAAAVRRGLMRDPFTGNGQTDAVYRFVLPPDANPNQPMVIETAFEQSRIEIWTGTAWADVAVTRGVAEVPAASASSGVVLARIPIEEFFGGFDVYLRAKTSGDPQ